MSCRCRCAPSSRRTAGSRCQPPAGLDDAGRDAYARDRGLHGEAGAEARRRVAHDAGDIDGDARPITHPVKFWENGSRPLEIVTNRQWYIRYPPKEVLLARGKELRWWPDFMRVRYENWVNGLVGDWNITRQRFFGVPFPVWYPVDDDGNVVHDQPILARAEQLPVDPSSDVPDGYDAAQRDQPGGFAGDPDVMDTWATSSLTPLIAGHWVDDPDLLERVFPMDLRPQAHEIIRTWLFSTIVRSHFEFDALPFANAAISGFVFDPDRKKLSKSQGNSPDDPNSVIAEYGSDAVRYWAAGGRPGMDVAFDRNQLKVGRRLGIKLLNASKFVLSFGEPTATAAPSQPLDLAVLDKLRGSGRRRHDGVRVVRLHEGARAHRIVLLVVLRRLRRAGEVAGVRRRRVARSATLRIALSVLLRLFAPILPFVTEDVWSWWQDGSIHRAAWPARTELPAGSVDGAVFDIAGSVLAEVRKAKTAAKKSLRADVRARWSCPAAPSSSRRSTRRAADVIDAGRIAELVSEAGGELTVDVLLAD